MAPMQSPVGHPYSYTFFWVSQVSETIYKENGELLFFYVQKAWMCRMKRGRINFVRGNAIKDLERTELLKLINSFGQVCLAEDGRGE